MPSTARLEIEIDFCWCPVTGVKEGGEDPTLSGPFSPSFKVFELKLIFSRINCELEGNGIFLKVQEVYLCNDLSTLTFKLNYFAM